MVDLTNISLKESTINSLSQPVNHQHNDLMCKKYNNYIIYNSRKTIVGQMSTSAQVLVISVKTTLLHVLMLNTWIIMENITPMVTTALLMATATVSTPSNAKTLPVLTCVEEWRNGRHN